MKKLVPKHYLFIFIYGMTISMNVIFLYYVGGIYVYIYHNPSFVYFRLLSFQCEENRTNMSTNRAM